MRNIFGSQLTPMDALLRALPSDAVSERKSPSWKRGDDSVSAAPALHAAALAALLSFGAAAFAQSAPLSWTMPTPHAPNTFLTANAQRFAEDLEVSSEGRIRIEVQSGGRLYAHEEIERAVRKGEVPVGEFMFSGLALQEPLFGADTVPFLASGYRKAERLWQASRATTERRLEARDLVLLFAVPVPPPLLFTRVPLDGDTALRGLQFRVPSDGARVELTHLLAVSRHLGAVPVPAGTWSLSAAFEEGRLEAMFLPPAQALGLGVQRFAPYFYPVHLWLPKSAVVLNRGAFEALDPALRDALLEAARVAEERGWRLSRREARRELARMEERGFSPMEAPVRLWADVVETRRESTVEWTERTGEEGVGVIQAFYAPR